VLNLPKADRLVLPSAGAADTLYILTTAHNSKLIWHLQTPAGRGGGEGGGRKHLHTGGRRVHQRAARLEHLLRKDSKLRANALRWMHCVSAAHGLPISTAGRGRARGNSPCCTVYFGNGPFVFDMIWLGLC
jgi:hypothetical protein